MEWGRGIIVMKKVGDVLQDVEDRLFMGRDAELQFMHDIVNGEDAPNRIVHLHGIGGMGKSALMRRFARDLPRLQVLYIEADQDYQEPEQFLLAVTRLISEGNYGGSDRMGASIEFEHVIERINRLASMQSRFVILIDPMERWNHIAPWLYASFLSQLPASLRIFTSGRYPIRHEQVKNISLSPLDHITAHQYIFASGIHNPSLRDAITQLSHGIPSALSICTKAVVENEQQFNRIHLSRTIERLCQSVLEGMDLSSELRELLEAAATVWRFDRQVLTAITGQHISTARFQQFCELPFVIGGEGGGSLVDGIRNWTRTEFENRAPDTCRLYKQNALEYIYQQWLTTKPSERTQLLLELLYHVENERLSVYYSNDTYIRCESIALAGAQLSLVEQMWLSWFSMTPTESGEEFGRATSIVAGGEQHAAMTAVWDRGRLAAYDVIVNLNEVTRDGLQDSKTCRCYIQNSEPAEDEILIWVGIQGDQESVAASSFILRHALRQLTRRKLFTFITPIEHHVTALTALGFTELDWANYESPDGYRNHVMQLDLRSVDLVPLLFSQAFVKPSLSYKETTYYVKEMLIHVHELEHYESLPQLKRVLNLAEDCENNEVASYAYQAIIKAIRQLEQTSDRNKIAIRTIDYAYIQRISSNEEIALRMHVSLSTFYRYQRIGIELLALYFNK